MRRLVVTYRLQFRAGMDFDRAAGLAPYLRRLGVSHLYASPLFQAVQGSTHGYDVTDHGALDESLGGMEGFLGLSAALKEQGLGLILDIVPNHMAASSANPWWRDVLRHGRDSRYARYFDIDWSAPELLITVLGRPYGEALEAGEFALGLEGDELVWRYYDHEFPLDPRTWPRVLGPAGVTLPDGSPPDALRRWLADDDRRRLEARLGELSADRELMHALHEAQPWRLAYWRAARDMLTHRRFFEITDLVGVRVEEEAVFDEVHRLLFQLVADGHIHGLRVDHVDGLADPTGYLEQLREKAPGNPPIWVEKILAPDEALPEAWPVEGTTGYEFARAVVGLVTNPAGIPPLDAAYRAMGGAGEDDYLALVREAKQQIMTLNLAAELEFLAGLAGEALADDPSGRDWGPDSLRRAINALAAAMPVYRTYLGRCGRPLSDADRKVLANIETAAAETLEIAGAGPVALLIGLLREGEGDAARRFRRRFQQTTGALMAKALEDTLFYRFNRLISANEVGAEPDRPTLTPDDFHDEMRERRRRQPLGLSTTATHDTKRGEDARMRIAAIAEAPEEWVAAVSRFEKLSGEPEEPEPPVRWLFYQALLGAWEPEDPLLPDRMAAYLVKAAREAKLRTSWVDTDEAYEERLIDFARRCLGDAGFREAFDEAAAPFIAMGARKSLAQLALKLTAPGVPDIYQGTERSDLSLVDPDNRREVDFAMRQRALDEPTDGLAGAKTALLRHGLTLRQAEPQLFAEGEYMPCAVEAPEPWRVLGFCRKNRDLLLAVAVELSGRDGGGAVRLALPAGRFARIESWPAAEPGPVGAALDLTEAFLRGPVSITLMRLAGEA